MAPFSMMHYVADACRIRIPRAHVANKTTQDDVSEL